MRVLIGVFVAACLGAAGLAYVITEPEGPICGRTMMVERSVPSPSDVLKGILPSVPKTEFSVEGELRCVKWENPGGGS